MKRILTVIAVVCMSALLLNLTDAKADVHPYRGGGRGYSRMSFGPPHYGRSFGGFRGGFGYRGYYRPYYGGFYGYGYPRIGFRLSVLPVGCYPFYFGPDLYYFNEGVYYRPYENNQFEIVAPPIGGVVEQLPSKANSIMIDGQQYFEFNGVYYKETVDANGKKAFLIAGKDGVLTTNNTQNAAPQLGDVVTQLPEGCRPIMLNGKKYFVSNTGVYYEEIVDANNNASYKVAGTAEQKQ
jgi:hypothetical protein